MKRKRSPSMPGGELSLAAAPSAKAPGKVSPERIEARRCAGGCAVNRPDAATKPGAAELLLETKAIHFRLRNCGVSAADLDEVTAETIAAAWESIERGRYQPHPDAKPRSVLRAWLQGVAWRRASTFLGRAYRRREVLFEQVPDDITATTEDEILARDELSLLDGIAPERRSVLLAHAAGCSMQSIAESLGIPVATGWSRLRQGRIDILAALRRRAARER